MKLIKLLSLTLCLSFLFTACMSKTKDKDVSSQESSTPSTQTGSDQSSTPANKLCIVKNPAPPTCKYTDDEKIISELTEYINSVKTTPDENQEPKGGWEIIIKFPNGRNVPLSDTRLTDNSIRYVIDSSVREKVLKIYSELPGDDVPYL